MGPMVLHLKPYNGWMATTVQSLMEEANQLHKSLTWTGFIHAWVYLSWPLSPITLRCMLLWVLSDDTFNESKVKNLIEKIILEE